MGAHAILISVNSKKAVNSSIPLAVVEKFRTNEGYPIRVDRTAFVAYLKESIHQSYRNLADFVEAADDLMIESDAHGQLSAYDVVFSDTDRRQYYFDTSW